MRNPNAIKIRNAVIALLTALGLLAAPVIPVYALKFGDILKAGGIVFIVKTYGNEINKGINVLMLNHKLEVKQATKVVPIVSLGQGLIAGAAQVTGPADLVRQVKAVAQIEAQFEKVQVKYLWPIKFDSYRADESARVPGVGISALLASRVSKIKI